ncbi:di-trans,poly-cis-decaprenylcistransferase [Methanofollis aquaemaris]|uniref:Di-trans,poly-cis-decaprenylcistransferase n=1 Tax=Methanofollis aquaemaris TaxID=126734 RepID=A0A8A3S6J1_9EURY|nr:undecaprenyl diphosphate synthase family protein [Methanofollis aquaemaris]QSZ67758.1 di-trans,poly-cis-decaprenylcistransferase [Methanofollis aquaemaris]
MIHWFYERLLLRNLTKLPQHVCFMITGEDMIEAPGKIYETTEWCREVGLRGATFHISTDRPEEIRACLPAIKKIRNIASLDLHYADTVEKAGEGMDVTVAVGMSGREEIAACIRKIAEEEVDPTEIDEELIERHLTFRCMPDLVIKTGGNYLTDFLIWQSVYSELFFLDVNWKWFRKVDFLRALRDYQSRARRFGT